LDEMGLKPWPDTEQDIASRTRHACVERAF
jgi:hypothetical protein